jgi:hypothetical protein
VSKNTILKWKTRTDFKDKSSRLTKISYALNELDTLITINLRFITWWALDEITEAIDPVNPE